MLITHHFSYDPLSDTIEHSYQVDGVQTKCRNYPALQRDELLINSNQEAATAISSACWTDEHLAAIVSSIPAPTDAELAAQAQANKDASDTQAARDYAKLKALRSMSPQQVTAWLDTNVTNLTQALDVIKTLSIAVAVLSRRL